MPTKEELVIEELQTRLLQLEAELKEVKASKAAKEGNSGSSEPAVRAFEPIKVEEHLTHKSQIKHVACVPVVVNGVVTSKGNPVSRPVQAPLTPDFFDLALERGYMEIVRGQNQGIKHEYRHAAPMVSYMYDALVKFKELAASDTITNPADRQSLAVLHAYLSDIYERMLYRIDYLKAMVGPGGRNPGLMQYVEEKVNNPLNHVPVTSSLIRDAFDSYNDNRLTHLMKAASKQAAEYVVPTINTGGASSSGGGASGSGGGGRGPAGRGKGGRGQPPPSGGGMVTRAQGRGASSGAGEVSAP